MFQNNAYDNNKDFSVLLKTLLESEPSAAPAYPPVKPEPTVTPAAGEDQSKRSLVNAIVGMRKRIVQQMGAFEQALTALNDKFGKKMVTFTTNMTGDAGSLEDMRTRFADLEQKFTEKSEEVDGILAKVQEVLPTLAGTPAADMLSKIGDGLAQMKQDLDSRVAEVAALSQKLARSTTAHAADTEDLQNKLFELDDYVQDVESKLADAKDRIKQLEKEKTRLGGTKGFDKDAIADFDSKPEHVQNYGKFDLLEHLARAKKKDKKNAADW